MLAYSIKNELSSINDKIRELNTLTKDQLITMVEHLNRDLKESYETMKRVDREIHDKLVRQRMKETLRSSINTKEKNIELINNKINEVPLVDVDTTQKKRSFKELLIIGE